MARRQTVFILDDIDGMAGANPVRFGLDDKWYTIDLSPDHEKELRAFLKGYVDAAGSASKPVPVAAGVTRNPNDVRKWLRANGVDVSARGRIPNVFLNMYDRGSVDPDYALVKD